MNNDFLNSLCCPRFCSYHFPPSDVSFSAWNVLILCAPSDQTHITGEGYVLLCELVHSGTKPLQLQEMAEVLLCRNCSPALWVRICSYIPYYEYTDELHTGVQKEIKCNFLKFFCARACPMGSDHAPKLMGFNAFTRAEPAPQSNSDWNEHWMNPCPIYETGKWASVGFLSLLG